jgi:HEAT repeat protein
MFLLAAAYKRYLEGDAQARVPVDRNDSNRHMCRAAARALGKLRRPDVVKQLVKPTRDQNEDALICCNAIQALGLIGDQKALPCLQIIASNNELLIMASAFIAMAKINGDTHAGRALNNKPIR